MTAFSKDQLVSALEPCALVKKVYFFQTIDSTNNRARTLAEKGAPEGTLVISEEQTAGRGRMGRSWNSPGGTGIWLSLLLRPPLFPSQAPLITSLAGVAVAEAIRRVTGLDAGIKWPNDILINGKKAAGILTELSADEEKIRHVIVGIGINVNTKTFPEEIRDRATSLRICSGRTIPRMEILLPVLLELERLYLDFTRSGDSDSVLRHYRKISVTIGERITLTRDNREFDVMALDISPTGGLLIKKDAGTIEELISGEIHNLIFSAKK